MALSVTQRYDTHRNDTEQKDTHNEIDCDTQLNILTICIAGLIAVVLSVEMS